MWRLVLQSLLISSLAISAIHNNLLKHGYFFHLFFFFQTTLGTMWLIYSRIIIDMMNYLSKCILLVEKYTVYCCQGNSHVTVIFYYWYMYYVKKKRLCTMLFFIYMDHQLLNCSVLLFLTKNKLWWLLLWHFIPLNCFIYLLPIPSYINSQLYMYIFYAKVFIGHQRLKWWNSVMFCIVYNLLYINFIYIVIIYMIYLHYSYGLYFKFYLRLYLTVLLWYL